MNSQQDEIQKWAESLSFDQLSNAQQLRVLQMMSSDKYMEIYQANRTVTSFLTSEKESLAPNESSLNALKLAAIKRNKKQVKLGIWSRSMPLYATAAACLFFFAFSFALFYKKADILTPSVKEQPMTQVIRDTIYLEQKIVEQVVHTVYLPTEEKKSSPAIATQYVPDEGIFEKEIAPLPDAAGIAKSFGNSPVDVTSLEQFKVQM